MKPLAIPALVLGLLLALSGCGGDGDAGIATGTSSAPPDPVPAPPSDRIEPLDTASLPTVAKALRSPVSAPASQLPPGARVPQIELGPLAEPESGSPVDDAAGAAAERGDQLSSAAGAFQGARALLAGNATGSIAERGGDLSAAGPSQGASAPSGGSAAGAAAERGGDLSAAGPSQGASAPSGGSAAGAAAERGGDITDDAGDAGAPLRIGVARSVAATADASGLARLLEWSTLPDGSRVAALAFVAPGAQALRLGVRAEEIPGGTVLRFYGTPGSSVVELDATALAALRALNEQAGLDADAARMAWGPDTDGPVGTLEVQLPPDVSPEDLQLAVPQLSHLTQTVAQALAADGPRDVGTAGRCNLDVMCTAYPDEGRAVAKIVFTRGGSTFLCTGTLLNDTRDSRTPYLLTASHCISRQSEASTLVSYWFFRAAACGASPRVDDAMTRVDGGARLLVTHQAADSTLVQLNQPPPPNVLYAGSYFGAGIGVDAEVVGIHHPKGDLQKVSEGSILGYANCPATDGRCQRTDATRGAMFRVGWNRGTTEGGSSGSALFGELDGTRYVVGALHGGNVSCSNPRGSDFYGRFERAFAAGLSDWLAP